MRENENNKVTVSGEIVRNFEFSHEIFGEGFYKAMLSVVRNSGTADVLPIMVSDRLVDVQADWTGRFVEISGQYRSYNRFDGDRKKLELYIFVGDFSEFEEIQNNYKNYIFLDGFICKKPIYRVTPKKRELSDVLLAVNRPYGKSDYVPLICWGRDAKFVEHLEIGIRLQIKGRIQSREYDKLIPDICVEKRIAYEVSVKKLDIMEYGV